MKKTFGVFSEIPSSKRLSNGFTMFDWVMRKNRFPAFWLRTVSGEEGLTKEEITFLESRNCKVIPVIGDFSESETASSKGSESGKKAVQKITELNIATGTPIFVYIRDGMCVNHNWMIKFARTLKSNEFIPGFMGNTDSSIDPVFDRQVSHFIEATSNVNGYDAVFLATEPKITGEPEEWIPFCPSAMDYEDMDLWMTGEIRFKDLCVSEVYAKNNKILY